MSLAPIAPDALLAFADEAVAHRIASSPQLSALLGAAIARAAAEPWPIADAQRWWRYLAERLPDAAELEKALQGWFTEDLLFCHACLEGETSAVAAFHARCLPVIASTLQRLRIKDPLREEVQQQLVAQLLVGDGTRAPKLGSYRGLARLQHWLRVVAAREARHELQRAKQTVPADEQLLSRLVDPLTRAAPSAEKEVYRLAFREAFREAIASLGPRELNLIRHRYADGLSLQQVGAIYRVHHTTVHRWLDAIQSELFTRTRQQMSARLRISEEDWGTVLRMLQSHLDLTLQTFLHLRPGGAEEEDAG